MDGHIHDSFIQGSVIFAFVLLFGLAWHLASTKIADKPLGQAMHFFY